ncbi:hypothetical protein BGZ58_001629 [Dissophora ornata]|nr:hypothetical protein BGZ58_001629 [Dissophora ornata]
MLFSALKKAIKAEKTSRFDDVAADELTLWRVSIPDDDDDDEQIILLNNVSEKKKLKATTKLSKSLRLSYPRTQFTSSCSKRLVIGGASLAPADILRALSSGRWLRQWLSSGRFFGNALYGAIDRSYTDNADRYPHMATHLQWLLAKEGVKEHVNFPAFVKQFRLGDRQSATDVYLTLINYSSIRESRREKLREEFSFFQKNNAQEFWASLDEAEDIFQARQDRGEGRVQWQEFKESEGCIFKLLEIEVSTVPLKSTCVPDPQLTDMEVLTAASSTTSTADDSVTDISAGRAFIKLGEVTDAEWDAVEFDERLPMKAVKLCLQNRKDDVAATLVPMNKHHRPIRIVLETLLEYLPKDEDRLISEYEYTVKYIKPVMQAFFESKTVTSHFPNKDSATQKKLGLRPDRPDFTATAGKKEIAWGEFSGPAHEHNDWKNLRDFFRDVRCGKAFLDSGFRMAPLFHVVYETGKYMQLRTEPRGMYILHEVG